MPHINQKPYPHTGKNSGTSQECGERITKRNFRFKFDPGMIAKQLHLRIVGQDHVIAIIEKILITIKADIRDPEKPLAVILFLGPTGVGKTEVAKVISTFMSGNTEKLCRIDMNTLAQDHYSAAITGAPPGYIGSKDGVSLFDNEAINGSRDLPGIVLFDEIEKADDTVIRTLLNIFDNGLLKLASANKKINFRNSIIFMTSNIGATELSQQLNLDKKKKKRSNKFKTSANDILLKALEKKFDPEFINRINHIVTFNHIDYKDVESVLHMEIAKLNKRLEKQHAVLHADASAIKHLSKDYDKRYGARSVSRRLFNELEVNLAKSLLENPSCSQFNVISNKGILQVTPLHTDKKIHEETTLSSNSLSKEDAAVTPNKTCT